MELVFNPTGTHIHKGLLRIRMDFIPELGEESYSRHHILMPTEICPYDEGTPEFTKWLKRVPKVERTNPCLGVFFTIRETTTGDELLDFLAKKFTADGLATLDYIQSLEDNRSYLKNFFKVDRVNLSREPVLTKDYVDLVQSVNQRFSLLLPVSSELGTVRDIESGTITIGSAVIARTGAQGSGITLIESVAADGTGTITVASFYFDAAYGDATGVEAATAYIVSGTNFTTRANAAIGGVTAGSKQDMVVDLDVVTGDYFASVWTGGRAETTLASGSCWYKVGDSIPCTNAAFTATDQTNSAGGTGAEAGGGIIPQAMHHLKQMAEV